MSPQDTGSGGSPPRNTSQFRSTLSNQSSGIRVIIKKEPLEQNHRTLIKEEPREEAQNNSDDDSSDSSSSTSEQNESSSSQSNKGQSPCSNEECDEPGEPSTSSGRPFSIRRGEISSTALRDEYEGLENLGIEVYDQPAYESQVFQQVDRAISHIDGQNTSHSAPTCGRGDDILGLLNNQDDQSGDSVDIEQRDQEILRLTREQRTRNNLKEEPQRTELDKTTSSISSRIPKISDKYKQNQNTITLSLSAIHQRISQQNVPQPSMFWQPSLATHPTVIKQENLKKSPDYDTDSKASSASEYKPSANDAESSSSDQDEDIGLEDAYEDYDTDPELGPEELSRPSKKLSPRKAGKVIDDGDSAYYNHRIKEYNRKRAETRLSRLTEDGTVESTPIDEMVKIEGDLQIPKEMWDNLFEHQKSGVKWLWELHQLGTGGILGDEMGLGKTIQMIGLLTALRNSNLPNGHKGYENLGPSVLVCPATVMYQWLLEFRKWYPPFRVAILHSTGAFVGDKAALVKGMNKARGILIVSYPGVVIYQDILHDYDWHYAILDEGHKIRNPDAQVTLACKRFRTPHRLILSGSPVQNNLRELWSIFDFIYPGKLGTLPVFMEQFATPITQGGYANASDIQVQIAYKCTCILRDTIKPFLLRRTKAEVNNKLKLPERSEQVLFCKLTDQQYNLYKNYLNSSTIREIKAGMCQIFVGLTQLRKICNHPDIFDASEKIREQEMKLARARRRNEDGRYDGIVTHQFDEQTTDTSGTYGHYKKSGKMMVVDALLKIWKKQGHKVLLFTQSRQMLKIFVDYLTERDYKHLCMDGTTSIGSRQALIDQFNDTEEIFIFLLTTKVGGVGINLTGANRIIIFDPDWNPSTDIQARERAWRIGQQRQVIIYRLLTAGTIEEKIYHRQVFKLYLTNRILKDAKQKRFFKTNDLHELFTLGDNEKNIETKALFDDELQINPGDINGKSSSSAEEKRKKKEKKDKKKKRKDKDKKTARRDEGKLKDRNKPEASSDRLVDSFASKLESAEKRPYLNSDDQTDVNRRPMFSEEKLRAMREQAKRLSQMIASQYGSSAGSSSSASLVESSKLPEARGAPPSSNDEPPPSGDVASAKRDEICDSNASSSKQESKRGSTTGSSKTKKRVKYLVRQDIYRPGCDLDEPEEPARERKGTKNSKQAGSDQDPPREDYILERLFKSSNVFGALKHDKIESDSTADFKVVESEAEKVARDAIRVLRESRRLCSSSTSGIPNWTGRNGQLAAQVSSAPAPSKPVGLIPKNKSRAQVFMRKQQQARPIFSSSSSSTSSITSSSSMDSLLSSIKKRNQNNPVALARATFGVEGRPDGAGDSDEDQTDADFQGRSQGTGAEAMAAKTRDFLLFESGTPGQAQTSEVLEFFNQNFKPDQTAIFKAILFKVCEFERRGDKGFWRIRNEFRN